MTTLFVERDEADGVVGIYAYPCQGVAEEELSDDNAEVVAFLNPHPPIPQISRRQFFQQAAVSGIITETEALTAVTTGALPAVISAFINSLPADQQFGARMLFSVNEFSRSSTLANAFGTAMSMSPEQVDAFFTAAAQL